MIGLFGRDESTFYGEDVEIFYKRGLLVSIEIASGRLAPAKRRKREKPMPTIRGVAGSTIETACQRQPPYNRIITPFPVLKPFLSHTPMSRQPSPGPSHFPPSAQHANNRQKSKNYTQGIAAGAEDAKYKTKYRELKKKVKEIEMVSQHDAILV